MPAPDRHDPRATRTTDRDIRVKICGLNRHADAEAALAAGADYIGLVRYSRSPRHVPLATAQSLAEMVGNRAIRTVLVVDPSDTELDALAEQVSFDVLQLHGTEIPERIEAIRDHGPWRIMKALGLAGPADRARLADYGDVADQILVDARPVDAGALPGGNGLTFDWTWLADVTWCRPWMLAGGLTVDNVATAVQLTGARQVDVSTGVESAPGIKDPDRMAAFVTAARSIPRTEVPGDDA